MSAHLVPPEATPILRKPTVQDVPDILRLLERAIVDEAVLPRTALQVAERLRDYTLVVEAGAVTGVASISLVDLHLAEVGVVVGPDAETEGRLVDWLMAEAEVMGVTRTFVLTDKADRFEAWGFTRTALAALPEKRDRQCLRCPRLPRCRQVALERNLAPQQMTAQA